jgi:hypothetical protein
VIPMRVVGIMLFIWFYLRPRCPQHESGILRWMCLRTKKSTPDPVVYCWLRRAKTPFWTETCVFLIFFGPFWWPNAATQQSGSHLPLPGVWTSSGGWRPAILRMDSKMFGHQWDNLGKPQTCLLTKNVINQL